MNELLQQLATDTTARRRSVMLVGASVVAVVAAAVVARAGPGADANDANPCAESVARAQRVWNEDRASAVE